jgi:hypothetical protein
MKKLLLLFFILVFCVSANAQTDCSVYRKGYFMFTDSSGNTILVQRKKKYQYQYNRKIKVRTQFIIKWNNDCEYSITQTLTNSKSLRQYKNSITVTVISKPDGDNGYYYTCNCKGVDISRKESFMKKITKQQFYKLY